MEERPEIIKKKTLSKDEMRQIEFLLRLYLGRDDRESLYWVVYENTVINVVHERRWLELTFDNLKEYFLNYHH